MVIIDVRLWNQLVMVVELLWSLDRIKYGDRIIEIGRTNALLPYQNSRGLRYHNGYAPMSPPFGLLRIVRASDGVVIRYAPRCLDSGSRLVVVGRSD